MMLPPDKESAQDKSVASLAGEFLARLNFRNPSTGFERFVAQYYAPLLVLAVLIAAVLLDYSYRNMAENPYVRGVRHISQQKLDAAMADFHKALRLNPSDIWSTFQLGYVYHQKNWLDEALKEFESAGAQALQIANYSYHNSGVILQNKGNLDRAIVAYKRSLGTNPTASNSLFNLLLIYESRQNYEPALRACQTYLESTPQDAAYLFRAGQFSEKLGRRDMAVQYYQKALAADLNSPAKDRLKILSPR